jgi:hypothetical protein
MIFYFSLGNQLSNFSLTMNFQNLGLQFLKEPQKLRIQFCNNSHLFLFQWKVEAIYFVMQWINMNFFYNINFLEKNDPWILFGQL